MDQSSDNENVKKIDVNTKTSSRRGIFGFFETALRKFRIASFMIALIPLYLIAITAMGVSATPAVYFFNWITRLAQGQYELLQYFIISCSLIVSYFIYGFSLIFVIPFFNFLMPFRLKPFRGNYYSLETVPWYFHNAFTYVVRYTFLEFITPTPICTLFYRLMGMKIGKNAHINTTNISDPCMIEIGDNVTIGGSAHVIAHYASKGFLIIAPVKIMDGATVGLKATIMGDVEIGERAIIGPHEVVMPKSRILAGRKPLQTDQTSH